MSADSDLVPTRQELARALMGYAVPDTRIGVRLFLVDFVVYAAGLSLALFASQPAWRVLGAVLVGLKMGSLYTLAHDAVHNSLTASSRLNKVLSAIGYLVSLHNYRIRWYDHLVIGHHPGLNGPQPDVYRPLSWQEYCNAPAWRRLWERFIRAPHVLAFAPYGILSRWLRAEVLPNKAMTPKFRAQAWAFGALLVAYLCAIVACLARRNGGDAIGLLADAVLVIGLPFFIMQTLQAAILYFQHTHPQIPWFGPGDARMEDFGPEALTVHVRIPAFLSSVTHDICEHPAHHVVPAIPCYRLRAAQARLNELLGDRALAVPLSPRVLGDIMRRCKVYDYEHHVWLDFKGQPTTGRTVPDPPLPAGLVAAA
ncbi:MAG TPA: fatty acid desaturase [Caldimonas sp.]|nr:fatty acid desaturase [Caldimonas sp.]